MKLDNTMTVACIQKKKGTLKEVSMILELLQVNLLQLSTVYAPGWKNLQAIYLQSPVWQLVLSCADIEPSGKKRKVK